MPRARTGHQPASKLRCGLRILGVNSLSDAALLRPDDVLKVIRRSDFNNYRSGCINSVFTQLGVKNEPEWKEVFVKGRAEPTRKYLRMGEIQPLKMNRSGRYPACIIPARKRAAAYKAMGFIDDEDILHRPMQSILDILLHEKDYGRRNNILIGTNLLFAAVNRRDRLSRREVMDAGLGILFSKPELKWIEDNRDKEWYIPFTAEFAQWLRGESSVAACTIETRKGFYDSCCRVVRAAGVETSKLDIQTINTALVDAICLSYKGCTQSLLHQKRGHRSGDVFDPLRGPATNYRRHVSELCIFLKIPTEGLITTSEIKRKVEKQLQIPQDTRLSIMPVDDYLTPKEMKTVYDLCENEEERLVILLLSRFGMRIGALSNLRIAGIVEDSDQLRPI